MLRCRIFCIQHSPYYIQRHSVCICPSQPDPPSTRYFQQISVRGVTQISSWNVRSGTLISKLQPTLRRLLIFYSWCPRSNKTQGTGRFSASREWISNGFGHRCHLCSILLPREDQTVIRES